MRWAEWRLGGLGTCGGEQCGVGPEGTGGACLLGAGVSGGEAEAARARLGRPSRRLEDRRPVRVLERGAEAGTQVTLGSALVQTVSAPAAHLLRYTGPRRI